MRIFETCQTPKRSFTKYQLETFDTLFPPVNLRLCSHMEKGTPITDRDGTFTIIFYPMARVWLFSNESDRDTEFKRLAELEY